MLRYKILLICGVALTLPLQVLGQDDVKLRQILSEPFTVTETQEQAYEVRVPYTETIVVERFVRYGLFGRKCRRVLYRYNVTRYSSETKLRSVQVARSLPPLTNPAYAQTDEPITLPGAESLAALPPLIDLVIKRHFDGWTVESSDVREEFARIRVKKDQTTVVAVVYLVPQEPKQLKVATQASIPGNETASQTAAQNEMTTLAERLKN